MATTKSSLRIKQTPSVFSPSQIQQWLSRIGFKQCLDSAADEDQRLPATLENLTTLMRLSLVAFPYENTEMHYTDHHTMDLTPEGLFQRTVVEGKGSYCFGLNGLFLGMLRGLGYRAYSAGARVYHTDGPSHLPQYTALEHMIILLQIDGHDDRTYLVDVGFGGSGLARPILLSKADDNVVEGTTPTEKHRLRRGAQPLTSLESSDGDTPELEWQLQVSHTKDEDSASDPKWRNLYIFSEHEFLPVDIEGASFLVSMRPGMKFTNNVVCAKLSWLDDAESESIRKDHPSDDQARPLCQTAGPTDGRYMGRVTMERGRIRRHVGSRTEEVKMVTTEAERIRALGEIFGIYIQDDCARHIKSRPSAL